VFVLPLAAVLDPSLSLCGNLDQGVLKPFVIDLDLRFAYLLGNAHDIAENQSGAGTGAWYSKLIPRSGEAKRTFVANSNGNDLCSQHASEIQASVLSNSPRPARTVGGDHKAFTSQLLYYFQSSFAATTFGGTSYRAVTEMVSQSHKPVGILALTG
jgi:hypothetical protein